MIPSKIILEIETKLHTKVLSQKILGEGQCNFVYILETNIGKMCLKVEKEVKPFEELNKISTEGKALEYLCRNKKIEKYIPKHILNSEKFYLYEYVEGLRMRENFSRIMTKDIPHILDDISYFHYQMGNFPRQDILDLGITEYQASKHKLGLDQHNLDVLSHKNKELVEKAFQLYTNSEKDSLPQLIHNDAHDGNIIVHTNTATFIDFGDLIWRDVHYDFYNYVVKYPHYWEIIVSGFEEKSGLKLNRDRIVSIALLRYLRSFLSEINEGENTEYVMEKFDYFRKKLTEPK